MAAERRARVAVLGAGIMGAASSLLLAQAGCDVTLAFADVQ
jgi:glycine/D-amino acid oxidase-like deaminating enzyme